MFTRVSQAVNRTDSVSEDIRKLTEYVRGIKEDQSSVRSEVRDELLKTRAVVDSLVETNRNIEESQEFLSNKFEELRGNFKSIGKAIREIQSDNEKLKTTVNIWQQKHCDLSNKVDRLEMELDKANRSALEKNAVVLGLPMSAQENVKDTVHKLADAVGCPLKDGDVTEARRLLSKNSSSRSAPLLVTFDCSTTKELLFQKKREHGVLHAAKIDSAFAGSANKVTIRDELTTFGKELLTETKNMQNELGLKFVWPGRDGKILVKRHEGAKIEQIGNRNDLRTLAKSTQKRSLNHSADLETSNITIPEMSSPKRINTGAGVM